MPSWRSARTAPSDRAAAVVLDCAGRLEPTGARNSGIRPANSVVCLVRPDRLMPWPLTGITAFDPSSARLDYRRPWLPAAGPADQCGTGAHGGHQRRLDHRTHRHQGTPHPEGRGARHLAHGGGSGARPAAEDRHQAGRDRPADLRHHHAGHAVPVDRQHHLRHGRGEEYRLVRRAGGLLGLSLFAHHRLAIHRQRHRAQDGGGGRRQDVVDHRLYRPRHLRAVRRRRRRRAAGAERRRHRHHGRADPLRRLGHDPSASEGRRQPHAGERWRRSPSACITSIRKAPRSTNSPSPRWRKWPARS